MECFEPFWLQNQNSERTPTFLLNEDEFCINQLWWVAALVQTGPFPEENSLGLSLNKHREQLPSVFLWVSMKELNRKEWAFLSFPRQKKLNSFFTFETEVLLPKIFESRIWCRQAFKSPNKYAFHQTFLMVSFGGIFYEHEQKNYRNQYPDGLFRRLLFSYNFWSNYHEIIAQS